MLTKTLKLISFDRFKDALQAKGSDAIVHPPLKKMLGMKCFSKIPYKLVEKEHPTGWSGKEGLLYVRHSDDSLDILHEFCHYLLCDDERLKCDEFGLGQGFRDNAIPAVRTISCGLAQEEEEAVCILAYSFICHMRLSILVLKEQIVNQNFDGYHEDGLKADIEFIRKRKERIDSRLAGIRLS